MLFTQAFTNRWILDQISTWDYIAAFLVSSRQVGQVDEISLPIMTLVTANLKGHSSITAGKIVSCVPEKSAKAKPTWSSDIVAHRITLMCRLAMRIYVNSNCITVVGKSGNKIARLYTTTTACVSQRNSSDWLSSVWIEGSRRGGVEEQPTLGNWRKYSWNKRWNCFLLVGKYWNVS